MRRSRKSVRESAANVLTVVKDVQGAVGKSLRSDDAIKTLMSVYRGGLGELSIQDIDVSLNNLKDALPKTPKWKASRLEIEDIVGEIDSIVDEINKVTDRNAYVIKIPELVRIAKDDGRDDLIGHLEDVLGTFSFDDMEPTEESSKFKLTHKKKQQEAALMSIAVVAKHLEDANNTLGSEVIGMALEVLNDPGAYTLSDIAGELLNVEGVLDNRDDMDKLNDEVRTLRIQVTSICGALRNVADALDNESNENEEWLHDAAYYVRALAGDDELEGQAVGKLWNKSEISPFLTDKHAKRELDVAYAGLSRILGVKYNEAVTGNKVSLKQKNSKMIHKKKQQEATISSVTDVAEEIAEILKKNPSDRLEQAYDVLAAPGNHTMSEIISEVDNAGGVLEALKINYDTVDKLFALSKQLIGLAIALQHLSDYVMESDVYDPEDEDGKEETADYLRLLAGRGTLEDLTVGDLWNKSEISKYLDSQKALETLDVVYAGFRRLLGSKYNESVGYGKVSPTVRTAISKGAVKARKPQARQVETKVKAKAKAKATPSTAKKVPAKEGVSLVQTPDCDGSIEWYVFDDVLGVCLAGPFRTAPIASSNIEDPETQSVISAADVPVAQAALESTGLGLFRGAYVVIREPATQGTPGGRKVDSGVVMKVVKTEVTLEGGTSYDVRKYNVVRLA